jgi:hypothetical protein
LVFYPADVRTIATSAPNSLPASAAHNTSAAPLMVGGGGGGVGHFLPPSAPAIHRTIGTSVPNSLPTSATPSIDSQHSWHLEGFAYLWGVTAPCFFFTFFNECVVSLSLLLFFSKKII